MAADNRPHEPGLELSGPQRINAQDSKRTEKFQLWWEGHFTARDQWTLTDEEKAVLIQCRRGSIARGLPLGIAGVLGLRILTRTGRLPSFITRHTVLFHIGIFVGCFTTGVNSYKKVCFDKIMSLGESRLADQVRDHMKKQNIPLPEKWKPIESTSPSFSRRPDNILDGKEEYLPAMKAKESTEDQPDAFGSVIQAYPESSNQAKHGRTFDEIREENRRKQMGNSFPPQSRRTNVGDKRDDKELQPSLYNDNKGKERPVKRNKYGDIIYDDV